MSRPLQTIVDRLDDSHVDVMEFRAVGDGVADDTTAILAAIEAVEADGGGIVIIPNPTAHYRVTSTITIPSSVKLRGGYIRPEIRLDSASVSRLFDLTGSTRAALESLTLNGEDAVAGSDFIRLSGSNRCELIELDIVNAPGTNLGSVLIMGASSKNLIKDCTFTDIEGTGIGLTGSGAKANRILHTEFTDCTGFGIRIGEGSNRNLVVDAYTVSNGIELVGVTQESWGNRVANSHGENTGDNGFSFSGHHNVFSGCIAYDNDKAGAHAWGNSNAMTGNVSYNNNQIFLEDPAAVWAGIGASANFGGTGQGNAICGNATDDDQASPTQSQGVRLGGVGYDIWSSGVATESFTYIRYGLNIYLTFAANGALTGATPPTHTSGDVSDGGVTWRYIRSFYNSAVANQNSVMGNTVLGHRATDYHDSSSWSLSGNALISALENDVGSFKSHRRSDGLLEVYGGIKQEAQAITAAGALGLKYAHHTLSNPGGGTYPITLDAPTASEVGVTKTISMIEGDGTNTVTMALTNVVGGSAASSALFNAAGETLVVRAIQTGASTYKWYVLGEYGVTLS